MEDLNPEHVLDMQTDARLHIIFGGTKVVQHIPPQKASTGLKRMYLHKFPPRGHVVCSQVYFTWLGATFEGGY